MPREPEDKAGDFQIFTEETPYSTYDFQYEEHEFEKLHNLIKFNTIINKQVRYLIDTFVIKTLTVKTYVLNRVKMYYSKYI